jgi:hypothetical protein
MNMIPKMNQGGKPVRVGRISTLLVRGSYFFFFAAFFFFLAAMLNHLQSLIVGSCLRNSRAVTLRETGVASQSVWEEKKRSRLAKNVSSEVFLPCGNVHFGFFVFTTPNNASMKIFLP